MSNHRNDSKRESELMKFLIQELNLDKIKEEQDNDTKEILNTPPPITNKRPKFSLPVSFNETT